MNKNAIIIGVLSFLLMCQTCSKSSSERRSKFEGQSSKMIIDSLSAVCDSQSNTIVALTGQRDSVNSLLNEALSKLAIRDEQVKDLKQDKINLNKQNTLLLNK